MNLPCRHKRDFFLRAKDVTKGGKRRKTKNEKVLNDNNTISFEQKLL
jgi:hypothetical protein